MKRITDFSEVNYESYYLCVSDNRIRGNSLFTVGKNMKVCYRDNGFSYLSINVLLIGRLIDKWIEVDIYSFESINRGHIFELTDSEVIEHIFFNIC